MDCHRCIDNLSAYLDQEMAPARAQIIEAHLRDCPGCAGEYRTLQASYRLVESHARQLSSREESWQLLRARLNALDPPAPRTGLLPLLLRFRLAAVATAITAVLFGMGFWGYLQYQKNEAELQRYMNAYIQIRDLQEHEHRLRMAETVLREATDTNTTASQVDRSDNPFATYQEVSVENPFQGEGR